MTALSAAVTLPSWHWIWVAAGLLANVVLSGAHHGRR
jgi:hypothetical protein